MKSNASLKTVFKILTTLLVTFFAPITAAQDAEVLKTKIRFYEDIAATLTSDELSDKALELVKSGASSDEILNEIKSHRHFAITVGSHWLKPLAILQGPDLRSFRTSRANGAPTTLFNVLPNVNVSNNFRNKDRTLEQRNADVERIIEQFTTRGPSRLRTVIRNCSGKRTKIYRADTSGNTRRAISNLQNAIESGKVTDFRDNTILLDISKDVAKRAVEQAFAPTATCECEDSVAVDYRSYRNSSRLTNVDEVKACKNLLRADYCGANLQNCYGSDLHEEVAEAISLEPAAIIGKTIQDEAKFRDVLMARKGAVNWILKNFMLNENKGAGLLRNTPGGYGDVSKVRNLPKDSKVFEWVNHKDNFGHGVGSTMAFQRATNGRRAKVNKLMQAFMCSEFKVPEGTVFVEDDNEDLTKRAFCSYCHRTLEPMANLYGKWPKLGSTDFRFDKDANAKGQFLGIRGDGPRELGKIIADSKQFKGCSVSRGFKFVFGRNMSNKEMRDIAPDLIKLFEEGENLWAVMKEAIKYKAKKYYQLDI